MRKLSLFIIAASATLGVSVAQADDAIQPVEGPDAVTVEPEVIVDPAPETDPATGELVDPALVTDDLVLYPVDEVVELPGSDTDPEAVEDYVEGSGEEGALYLTSEVADTTDAETGTTGEEAVVTEEEAVVTEEEVTTDSGDDSLPPKEETAVTDEEASSSEEGSEGTDELIYMTTGGVDPRPEGCMECRNLTGMTNDTATEAPAPEVMADVLDGNATGVDVMDPAEAKKRK